MEKFKKRWEISKDWQLLFPLLGIAGLLYSAFRLSMVFTKSLPLLVTIILTGVLYFVLLRICLFFFKKLENKWIVKEKWEMIRIFIVFAITGSTTAFIGRPLMAVIGITKENLNPSIYWALFIIIGLIFYQLLLVTMGWLFGQFDFFWAFEKKMLKRMGFKKFIKD
ncbi:MAG: hypothetical protein KJP09_11055 [Bacteroidia bacterium]|nr:hypothetical protein [Bacteroidia bacterium]NNK26857.1 hypothetical protein [Flavobacteriaceae bacterium]